MTQNTLIVTLSFFRLIIKVTHGGVISLDFIWSNEIDEDEKVDFEKLKREIQDEVG